MSSRATMSRLARLEAAKASAKGSHVWHRVIGDSDEEAYAAQAALVASGEASEGDNFIHRIIVTPPPRASDETRARAAEALYDWEAAWRCVLYVTPTTVTGAVALAAFLASHNDETGGDENAREALNALATSLKYFSGMPQ